MPMMGYLTLLFQDTILHSIVIGKKNALMHAKLQMWYVFIVTSIHSVFMYINISKRSQYMHFNFL